MPRSDELEVLTLKRKGGYLELEAQYESSVSIRTTGLIGKRAYRAGQIRNQLILSIQDELPGPLKIVY